MAIKVLRGGKTSNEWYGKGRNVSLGNESPRCVTLNFELASKGGGTTEVAVKITGTSFEALAEAMMKAAPKDAVKAFGVALSAFKG